MKITPVPEVCEQQLRSMYWDEIVDQAVAEPTLVPLPDQPGESVPYIRLNKGASKPIFYVPGFSENTVNKLSMAAELASRGFDVIVPGQNRTGTDWQNPSDLQARNYEAVLADAGVEEADFISHSYGSLVLDALVRRVSDRNPDYFKNSRALLLAPAGVGYEKSYRDIARRWVRMLRSETDQQSQEFPDLGSVAGKASLRTLFSNLRRSVAEVREMRHRRIDFENLATMVGEVTLLSYAEDEMFPNERIAAGAAEAVEAGCTWAVPISLDSMPDGAIRSGRGATHDDEQLNPSRVGGAVAQLLKSRSTA